MPDLAAPPPGPDLATPPPGPNLATPLPGPDLATPPPGPDLATPPPADAHAQDRRASAYRRSRPSSPRLRPLVLALELAVSLPVDVRARPRHAFARLCPSPSSPAEVVTLSPFLRLSEWFLHELLDPTGFELAQGQNFLDFVGHDAKFAKIFNDAMVAGSSFMMDIVVTKCSDVFHGISSLLDVAGGLGGASQAISKVFPHVKCSVLDLPHVVAAAPTRTNVEYIAGDMFQSIPPTNTVFLKWVLHDWGDAECVKILRNCKNVIPLRDAGGKVLIFDMVVRAGTFDIKHRETQVLFDLFIMIVDGVERGEQGWKKIILEAGFSDYKIIPVVGVRSIIEVHP
ncbi:hypothetical protein QOZ80_5AG0366670 [Eleusine coracana subsp. coracana]|nr:hypothetical protein QOZ80_5AG0366670 [Eleusine coracana subsp. coracana]